MYFFLIFLFIHQGSLFSSSIYGLSPPTFHLADGQILCSHVFVLFCFCFLIFSTWLKWILNQKRKRREKGTWSVQRQHQLEVKSQRLNIYLYTYIYIYIYMLLLSGIPGCCFGLLTFVARVKPRGLVAATGSFIAHTHTHCNITEKPSFLFQISPPETVLILSTWKRLYTFLNIWLTHNRI